MASHKEGRNLVRLGSTFTRACVAVFSVYALSFLLSLLPVVGDILQNHALLLPQKALWPEPWRLFTAPLFVLSPFSLLFLGLLLWSLGSAIEQRIGARRFVTFCAVVLLTSSVVVASCAKIHALFAPITAAKPIYIEAGPVFTMMFFAFAQLYGGLTVQLWGVPQKTSGRTLAWFFIGIGFVAHLFRAEWELLCADLTTLFITALLLRDHGGLSLSRWFRRKWRSARVPKLEVHEGGRTKNPSPFSNNNEQRWLN
jgi:membrane associated rhomboid family serine protease